MDAGTSRKLTSLFSSLELVRQKISRISEFEVCCVVSSMARRVHKNRPKPKRRLNFEQSRPSY